MPKEMKRIINAPVCEIAPDTDLIDLNSTMDLGFCIDESDVIDATNIDKVENLDHAKHIYHIKDAKLNKTQSELANDEFIRLVYAIKNARRDRAIKILTNCSGIAAGAAIGYIGSIGAASGAAIGFGSAYLYNRNRSC